jgi:hypothetical protein
MRKSAIVLGMAFDWIDPRRRLETQGWEGAAYVAA